jgi:hyperosmotically inducible protein
MKRVNTAVATLVLATFLGACAPTQTQRSAGQTVDDATLTAKVKTELAQSRGVGDALSINVDTYRGVVSLAGFVNNSQEAQAAASAARGVEGVREVKNNLQVKPRP